MQIAESQFATPPGKGHEFVLRIPPSKATAKRCRECGCDVFEHSQSEVREGDVMKIVEVCSDRVPSEINPQLLVGGCFSVMAIASQPDVVVLNCAGTALHAFYPKTRKPFDELRAAGRLLDLEWQDSESFVLPEADVLHAVAWARQQTEAGKKLLVNCVQGKSRSGTAAVAYLMQTCDLTVEEALARVKARRSLVEPNPSFMRQLHAMEPAIRGAAAPLDP